MTSAGPATPRLCVAMVWGTTVVAMRHLAAGESLELGEAPAALAAKPLGANLPDVPLRAGVHGWELDVRGATGGSVSIGSRTIDPRGLAQDGKSTPIGLGDHGLVEFGPVALFFQLSSGAPPLPRRTRRDPNLFWALLFAATTALGGLLFLKGITSPQGLGRPLPLLSRAELQRMLRVRVVASESPSNRAALPSASARVDGGAGAALARGSTPGGDEASRRDSEIHSIADALGPDAGEDLRRALDAIPGGGDTGPSAPRVPVAMPPLAPEGSAVARDPPHRGLDPGEINAVMAASMASFQACYDAQRVRQPDLAGKVSVRFSVLPSGAVSSAAVTSSTLKHKGVERCLVERFRALSFPAAPQRTISSFGFRFPSH